MSLKVTQGRRNCRYSTSNIIFLLLVGNLITTYLCLAPFTRYYRIYSARDCLWPWEVLQFR